MGTGKKGRCLFVFFFTVGSISFFFVFFFSVGLRGIHARLLLFCFLRARSTAAAAADGSPRVRTL